MNETTQPAVAGPVEPTVRPVAWRAVGGSIWGHKTSDDDEPLYDQTALDAAVAAERERCAKVADEHARRNYPWGSENTDRYHAQADWAERIAAVIRRA